MTTYVARVLQNTKNRPATWNSIQVGVFRKEGEREEQVGAYVRHYPFGFAAGCIWGDDSSWKVEYLDVTEVENGIVKRDSRFGYIELPDGMALKQAVQAHEYGDTREDDRSPRITIAV